MISGLGLLAERTERLRQELERRAFHPGTGDFSEIEYCTFCSWSRSWIALHGHGEKCLLRASDNGDAGAG